jgi:hypothetical protein
MIRNSSKRNNDRNESDILLQFEYNTNKIDPRYTTLLEKGKKLLSQCIDAKHQRLSKIEKELEIARFEEDIKLFDLNLRLRYELERFAINDNIISLNEESEEKDQPANFTAKKANKEKKRSRFNNSH